MTMSSIEFPFAPVDDYLHAPSASFYETETYWFSFFIPERNIGAWIYTTVRQNVGVTGGGLFLWDDTATEPWDLPFYEQFSVLKPPTFDGVTMRAPTGATITVVEPGLVYDVAYDDRDRVQVSLRFEALEPPVPLRRGAPPFGASSHYDQTGHVSGTLVLDGESMAVDCYAMRDRSWGPRPERRGSRIGYTWLASPEHSLMTFTEPSAESDDIHTGYVRRADRCVRVVGGHRIATRNPKNAWIETLDLFAVDEDGGEFVARGHALSRFVLPSATGVCVNTLLRFDVNGAVVYGEDQDVWPAKEFRAARQAR